MGFRPSGTSRPRPNLPVGPSPTAVTSWERLANGDIRSISQNGMTVVFPRNPKVVPVTKWCRVPRAHIVSLIGYDLVSIPDDELWDYYNLAPASAGHCESCGSRETVKLKNETVCAYCRAQR